MEENTTRASSPHTTTTSIHANNEKIFTNSSKTREEGELSASENGEVAGSQFPDSTTVPQELNKVAPLNRAMRAEMGKSALNQNPTSSAVDLRNSAHSNHHRGSEKNRVPFVISFSDDDSGSDSEEYRQTNTVVSDEMRKGAVEKRKLSASLGNSQVVQHTVRSNTKIPKKLSISRTFVSSMNKTNGTSSRSGGYTFGGRKSHLKESSAPNKNKVGQNVHVNSSKLQDLRQLIAIRENELKSRAAKHDKETSGSFKNHTAMNSNNAAARSKGSVECLLGEPKEPEKKRLKAGEPDTNTLTSVSQYEIPPTESILAAENSTMESHGQKGKFDSSRYDKEISIGAGQSLATQQTKNKGKDHDIPSTNLPLGMSIIRNNRQHNRITKLAESSAPLTTKSAASSQQKQASLNNSSFWNHFGTTNMPGTGDMDIQSLLEIEELQDKELEEAQDYRRKCEIEERTALKAYRKAQRALAEANAKCSYLYRKRELFSANLRSHVMEDSSLFWSKLQHDHMGANVNSQTNMSENNMHLVPISSRQLHNEFNLQDEHQYDSNARSTDDGLENISDLHEDGENLVSESCSEADTSASEPRDEEKANDVCSSLHEKNTLAEDEQTSAFELKAGESSLDSQGEGICSGRAKEINDEPFTLDPTEDSLLLEATLRSQLFARLGIKTSKKKNGPSQILEPTGEREDGEIMEGTENIPSSEAEKDQLCDTGEKGLSDHPMDTKNQCLVEKFSINYESSSMAKPILRSAFGHVKFGDMISSVQSHAKNLQIYTNDISVEKELVDDACVARPAEIVSNSKKSSLLDMRISEVGSNSNDLAINPFWPLCMFELRGKCNDDECPWQHVRDYSSRSIDCNSTDGAVGSLRSGNGTTNVSKCLSSLPLVPPMYLVCLDVLKADSDPYKYILAQSIGQRWQKSFSASLVLSSSFLPDLHLDEPFLHGPEVRIVVNGGWNRQSSYFHGKNSKEHLPDQPIEDSDQALETALLHLSREVNKQKGCREALIVLARALEQHPTSVLLWIVYLHIYYSNQKSIGKDDLFRYAVDHNEASYELWLMFINSRNKLRERLLVYDTALSALCRHASAPGRDTSNDSECILDLFLQMMNCLCSSGEVSDAIQKIDGLFPSTKESSDLRAPFLPDVITCLTISDKCVFWVCSVYLVMYKKLPDTIVQQIECPKELSAIEWHAAHLTADEKQKAVTLMELAVDSLALFSDSESFENRKTFRAAHDFALNHVRCIAVLEGVDRSKNLLRKYIQLYPSCLELVLLSVRAKEYESDDATYEAFEEALCRWVGEPGIQCIWNQYAECALLNGRVDFAKELMERWFHFVWEVQYPRSEILNINAWTSSSSQTDVAFGLLNLSLHKQLQNEHTEARIAIEQALEVASAVDYRHCIREHAVFMLKNGFNFDKTPRHGLFDTLNNYLTDSRALPPSEPLSRSFIKSIEKPRVQQLVNNLLSPVSSDFSLLNSVLESCFGPSLIRPQAFERVTDMVDFAEAFMEIRLANYQLALSLCKTLSRVNASVSFWASSILINSLFHAVPVAPESVWLEAAGTLKSLTDIQSVLEGFHKRALSIYPFSMKLWKSYLALSTTTDQVNTVIRMAREKGIKLD